MNYRIRSTGEVKTQGDIRKLHPNTSLPRVWDESICEALGIDVIFEGPQAAGGDHYQFSQSAGIEQINGKWYTKYVLGPIFTDNADATASEQEAAYKAQKDAEQAKSVRAERDRKLAECDWVTLKAIDASNDNLGIQLPQVWMTYRQALRDITAQAGFPWNVTWPDAP
jgi:hypothetical protein